MRITGQFFSVSDCKERWRNLRGSYTRYLKYQKQASGSAAKKKKPYYLAEYMTFLLPYTKSREIKGSVSVPDNSNTEIIDFDDELFDENIEFEHSDSFGPTSSRNSSYEIHHDAPVSFNEGETARDSERASTSGKINQKTRKKETSLDSVNRTAMEYFQVKKKI